MYFLLRSLARSEDSGSTLFSRFFFAFEGAPSLEKDEGDTKVLLLSFEVFVEEEEEEAEKDGKFTLLVAIKLSSILESQTSVEDCNGASKCIWFELDEAL
jgi:hypothetical protein